MPVLVLVHLGASPVQGVSVGAKLHWPALHVPLAA
jgi:hypothetical protein